MFSKIKGSRVYNVSLKLSIVAILVSLGLLMSGFAYESNEIKLNADGSGDYMYVFKIKKSYYGKLSGVGVATSASKTTGVNKTLLDYFIESDITGPKEVFVKNGFKYEETDLADARGVTATKHFNNLTESKILIANYEKDDKYMDYDFINALMNGMTVTNQDTYVFNVDVQKYFDRLKDSLDNVVSKGFMTQETTDAYEAYVKIHLFDTPVSHNGTLSQDGKTITWDRRKTKKLEMTISAPSMGGSGAGVLIGIVLLLILIVGGAVGFIIFKKRKANAPAVPSDTDVHQRWNL